MESFKLVVKFYVQDPSAVKRDQIVPVFHSWIQFHSVRDHQLIDVADYDHVHNGPGTVLVAHEANFYLDDFDGRLGFSYSRKQPIAGSFTDRLRYVFRMALESCQLLEENTMLEGIRFRTDQVRFQINDRLFAPNTPEVFESVKPELEAFLRELYEGEVTLAHRADPRRLFEVEVRAATAPTLAALLSRSGASVAAGA